MKRIHLTQELAYDGLTIEKAIANRRSQRDFTGETMSLAELAHLLYYSSGITDKRQGLRAAPSAGATFPIEVYAIVNNVEGIAKGTYHYLIPSHELELLREGDFRNEMSRAALQERMFKQANAIVALAAVFQQALAVVGADRLLFGSDSSFFPRGWVADVFGQQSAALDAIGAAPQVREKIFGGNFDRLFAV